MVTVKAKTEDVIVVALDAMQKRPSPFWLRQGITVPTIVRIYRDRIEIDAEVIGQRKKTFKFWYHDLLLMNETLFRITHPVEIDPSKEECCVFCGYRINFKAETDEQLTEQDTQAHKIRGKWVCGTCITKTK